MGHVSRHRNNSVPRKAARIALVLGALTFAGSVLHFSYTAYESSQCYTESADTGLSQEHGRLKPVDSDDCRLVLASSEQHQRIDAALAMLAIIVGIGAAVRLSSASRHTRRRLLLGGVAVVALAVYVVVLTFAFR